MRTRVKICGITNLTDAVTAVAAGADALGFIFVPDTPRYITPTDASKIIKALPPFIVTVGVFRNTKIESVKETTERTGITTLQLHGSESPEYCSQLPLPTIKVFELFKTSDLQNLKSYNVEAFLVDKPKSIASRMINLDLASKAREQTDRLILAGGLTPKNVAEAVKHVKPYAVDVASGVEMDKRKKDENKIIDFISAVNEADAELLLK